MNNKCEKCGGELIEGSMAGMHVFEWWGGEYHPLEELIAEMDELKRNRN